MIKAMLELELVYPYNRSMGTLADFCGLWDCTILKGGTNSVKVSVSMPSFHFKKIFGVNPRVGEYNIPSGMEKFIAGVKVEKIITG